MSKEAMKLALDLATMHHTDEGYDDLRSKVRVAAKEALAKQEQGEPVAEIKGFDGNGAVLRWFIKSTDFPAGAKFYTTPQQRKPLTDEQIADIVIEMNGNEPPALFWKDLTRAIEAAHGIKENT